VKRRKEGRLLIRDTHATPAFCAKSAQTSEKKRVSLRKTASLAEVARDKKERGKSAQPIEKKRDENCTTGAKSEKEGWFGDRKAFGEKEKQPGMEA